MSPSQRLFRRFKRHRSGVVGATVVIILAVIALTAPYLAPVDPIAQELSKKFIPPIWQAGGAWPNVLGTDVLGRDLLSRILFGARLSLLIGLISVGVGALIGVPLGMTSGYVGGKVDTVLMRLVDVMFAFPAMLLAVVIVAIMGPSLENATIAVGIVQVPQFARIARGAVLSERERDYVLADRSIGRGHAAILFRGMLPNIFPALSVVVTLSFASAVLEAAGLSFLGLGAQPPIPEWGALIHEGKEYLYQAWWLIAFPGVAIFTAVLGFNLLGDALRDVLDPKLS